MSVRAGARGSPQAASVLHGAVYQDIGQLKNNPKLGFCLQHSCFGVDGGSTECDMFLRLGSF